MNKEKGYTEEDLLLFIYDLKMENKKLQQENEKLNHYKLLYQKVKDRNDKAIDYIEDRYDPEQKVLTHTFDKDNVEELYKILEGKNDE